MTEPTIAASQRKPIEPRGHGALSHIRVCDMSGHLAGAGATRFLAALGAEVIRVEDPVRQGTWDILRGNPPYRDERRGIEFGGGFNNHNVEKYGITLNLRTARGKELLRDLIATSDVVTENFAAGVFARLGFDYETLRAIKPDIIYVSNCGFGYDGPYSGFKSWGPIVQAVCGLSATSRLPGMPPAGWGFSYMDHHGANFMAVAILGAILHRQRTGEGQWIDMACTEAGATLVGLPMLDYSVNGTTIDEARKNGSNRNRAPAMAPHGIYPAAGDDEWVAIACRDEEDWARLRSVVAEPWTADPRFVDLAARLNAEDDLDELLADWTRSRPKDQTAALLVASGVPAAAVTRPRERCDFDASTQAWNLFPEVEHGAIGRVRVDGLPIHLSETDWAIRRGGPLLGEHNDLILSGVLGLSAEEIDKLREEGVL